RLDAPDAGRHAAGRTDGRRSAAAASGGPPVNQSPGDDSGRHTRHEPPVLEPGHTYATVTAQTSAIVLSRPTASGWLARFLAAFALLMVLLYASGYLFARGIGIWGTNIPVGWAFPIINFVWWIGIGHAGTLISAVLLLLHQEWRTSINRFAE